MKFAAVAVLFATSVLPFAASGCIDKACVKALPALTGISIMIDDATTKLESASDIVSKIPDPVARQAAQEIIAGLRDALITAETAANTAADNFNTVCQAPDAATIFKVFVQLWVKLLPYISAYTGPNGAKLAPPIVVVRYGVVR